MPDDAGISQEDLQRGLDLSAASLSRHRIRYALIGGMATGYRSQPRFTKDVDFLLEVPQLALPILLDDLRQQGFAFDEQSTIREWTQHHMTSLEFQGIRIDWLKPILPAFSHILDRTTEVSSAGQPLRIASAEGLILLKLVAFRPQDRLDIENLVAAHPRELDVDWIRAEWQTLAGLDDPRMKQLMNWIDEMKSLE